jgi:hypothetical protein
VKLWTHRFLDHKPFLQLLREKELRGRLIGESVTDQSDTGVAAPGYNKGKEQK